MSTDGTDDSGADPVAPADVEHVAELARVAVDDDDVARFTDQFAEVLEYFETLDEVPEIDDEPELVNVMRPDEVAACLDQAAALQNAPEDEDGQFKGPRVS